MFQQPNNYNYCQNQQLSNYTDPTNFKQNQNIQAAFCTVNLDPYPQRPYSRSEEQQFSTKNNEYSTKTENNTRTNDKNFHSSLKPLYNNTYATINKSSTSFAADPKFSLQKVNSDSATSYKTFDVEDDLKVALTGDPAIDEEILAFYRARNSVNQKLSTTDI